MDISTSVGTKRKSGGSTTTASGSVVKKSRKISTDNRKWTEPEVDSILEFMKDTITSNKELEKPSAAFYYDSMISKLTLTGCTTNQLKNKVRHLKLKYTAAVEWRNGTGAGVLETDGEQSVLDYIHKICPNWDILDEIYGSKVSIQPPYLYKSNNDNATPDADLEEPQILSDLAGNVTTESSGADDLTGLEEDNVDTIRRKLVTVPKAYKRFGPKESLSALNEAQMKRAEAMTEKVRIESQRLQFDNQWKAKEFELKEREFDMKKEQLAADERIRILQLEKEERIERFKIEQDYKLQLEMAKLNNESRV